MLVTILNAFSFQRFSSIFRRTERGCARLQAKDVFVAAVGLLQPDHNAPAVVQFRELGRLGQLVPIRLSNDRNVGGVVAHP